MYCIYRRKKDGKIVCSLPHKSSCQMYTNKQHPVCNVKVKRYKNELNIQNSKKDYVFGVEVEHVNKIDKKLKPAQYSLGAFTDKTTKRSRAYPMPNLTSDIPLADKRQILNRIVRFGGSPHTRWPFLYREFDNKFHMNTKVQLEHYNETHKPKLQNRLDYIEHIGMFNDLAEIACVIFGPDIEKLSAQYYEICK